MAGEFIKMCFVEPLDQVSHDCYLSQADAASVAQRSYGCRRKSVPAREKTSSKAHGLKVIHSRNSNRREFSRAGKNANGRWRGRNGHPPESRRVFQDNPVTLFQIGNSSLHDVFGTTCCMSLTPPFGTILLQNGFEVCRTMAGMSQGHHWQHAGDAHSGSDTMKPGPPRQIPQPAPVPDCQGGHPFFLHPDAALTPILLEFCTGSGTVEPQITR